MISGSIIEDIIFVLGAAVLLGVVLELIGSIGR